MGRDFGHPITYKYDTGLISARHMAAVDKSRPGTATAGDGANGCATLVTGWSSGGYAATGASS